MPRRPDPERIYVARRSALVARLIGDGLPASYAEGWVSAWERSTESPRHSQTFWDLGVGWIDAQRAARNKPPTT